MSVYSDTSSLKFSTTITHVKSPTNYYSTFQCSHWDSRSQTLVCGGHPLHVILPPCLEAHHELWHSIISNAGGRFDFVWGTFKRLIVKRLFLKFLLFYHCSQSTPLRQKRTLTKTTIHEEGVRGLQMEALVKTPHPVNSQTFPSNSKQLCVLICFYCLCTFKPSWGPKQECQLPGGPVDLAELQLISRSQG